VRDEESQRHRETTRSWKEIHARQRTPAQTGAPVPFVTGLRR
jgi:hypothetical protein